MSETWDETTTWMRPFGGTSEEGSSSSSRRLTDESEATRDEYVRHCSLSGKAIAAIKGELA